jgi:hypothetical protein
MAVVFEIKVFWIVTLFSVVGSYHNTQGVTTLKTSNWQIEGAEEDIWL